ncbi:MAG: hypothetical protein ACF8GE_08955 [Phycisphaerales bacterium JB043]
MSCYYLMLIIPAAIVSLSASGVMRDMHLPQDWRYITMLIVGLGFPGWAWVVHFGMNFVLAGMGVEGHAMDIHSSDMTAPYHIALSASVSGIMTSVVFGVALRSWVVGVSMVVVSLSAGMLCLLSPAEATVPPGMIVGVVVWSVLAVAVIRLWGVSQRGVAGRSRSGGTT